MGSRNARHDSVFILLSHATRVSPATTGALVVAVNPLHLDETGRATVREIDRVTRRKEPVRIAGLAEAFFPSRAGLLRIRSQTRHPALVAVIEPILYTMRW